MGQPNSALAPKETTYSNNFSLPSGEEWKLTSQETELDKFREYKNESYDEVINKVLFIAKNVETEPALSKQTIKSIEQARERIKKGKFLNESEARKRLGL